MRLGLPVTTLTAPCSATGASDLPDPALLPQAASRQAPSASTEASRRAPGRWLISGDTGADPSATDGRERRARSGPLQPHLLQESLQFASLPRHTPSPCPGVTDRGTQVVWGEPHAKPWGAQALSAPARQLTPEADERGVVLLFRTSGALFVGIALL